MPMDIRISAHGQAFHNHPVTAENQTLFASSFLQNERLNSGVLANILGYQPTVALIQQAPDEFRG
jgi:hypothetical protein